MSENTAYIKSVKCELMTEKMILEYEKSLQGLYDILSIDINRELSFLFTNYGKDNKLPYANVRNKLNNSQYKEFMSLLTLILADTDMEIMSKYLLETAKKLKGRKTITILEYLQFMLLYRNYIRCKEEEEMIFGTLEDVYSSAYAVSMYNIATETSKDISYVDYLDEQLKSALYSVWNNATNKERLNMSQTKLYEEVAPLIPRLIAMGYDTERIMQEVKKVLTKRLNQDKSVMRTIANYTTNKANLDAMKNIGLDKYVYVAILDERTTEQCRSLHGSVFNVSQAVVGINFPPLHINCRSSVSPKFSDSFLSKLSNLDNLSRKQTVKNYLEKHLPDVRKDILNKIYKNFI